MAVLITVDLNTGAAAVVGASGLGRLPVLAVNSSGELYTTESGSLIYQLDATTGEATEVVTTGFYRVRAMAFDGNDQLYVMQDNRLYSLNLSSGVSTSLGAFNEDFSGLAFEPGSGALWAAVFDGIYTILSHIDALAFSPEGILYGADSDSRSIYEIDMRTGTTTEVMQTTRDLKGFAFNPTDSTLWASSGTYIYQIDPESGEMDQIGAPRFYEVTWDSRDDRGIGQASGVYIFHLKAGRNVESRRMTLLK